MAAALIGVSVQMKSIAKNAKTAKNALKDMQKSVKAVESGLNALGSLAKSAMQKVISAFNSTASKAESAGRKVGTGFVKGLQSGLIQAPIVAMMITTQTGATLKAGEASAYSAGAFISQGFARGMKSCLSVVRSAATQLAAAAEKAVKAKAKIGSPSKVADKLATWWGEGYERGLLGMVGGVWDAAEKLVTIPQVATPNLALGYSGELSEDYEYYRRSDYTIEVPLTLDGKTVARATAKYTQEELDKQQTRNERKKGNI
jgi:hypothetical protein